MFVRFTLNGTKEGIDFAVLLQWAGLSVSSVICVAMPPTRAELRQDIGTWTARPTLPEYKA